MCNGWSEDSSRGRKEVVLTTRGSRCDREGLERAATAAQPVGAAILLYAAPCAGGLVVHGGRAEKIEGRTLRQITGTFGWEPAGLKEALAVFRRVLKIVALEDPGCVEKFVELASEHANAILVVSSRPEVLHELQRYEKGREMALGWRVGDADALTADELRRQFGKAPDPAFILASSHRAAGPGLPGYEGRMVVGEREDVCLDAAFADPMVGAVVTRYCAAAVEARGRR